MTEIDRKKLDRIERWDPAQRYRPYVVRGGALEWLGGAGCGNETGIVPMLLQLAEDEEFDRRDHVGVLDTIDWRSGQAATWIISPWGPPKVASSTPAR